jgi:hypothetical protein
VYFFYENQIASVVENADTMADFIDPDFGFDDPCGLQCVQD